MTRGSRMARLLPAVALLAVWWLPPVGAAVVPADPGDYRDRIDTLQPGDTLQLAAGTYTRLTLTDLHGTPDNWITISGPASGPPAVIEGESCCNTVQLRRCSYLVIKNLTVDSLGMSGIDGINAKEGPSHHIVIENNLIRGAGGSQQTVGINTKSETWNWIIRNNTILEPGTGIYLGDSTGSAPFIAGIIEGNLVRHSTGYCMQIKHQNPYFLPAAPAGPNVTVIRNNVFLKDDRPSPDGSRPNLLVGTFPTSGPGAEDRYEIYGNFIHHNYRESLIQATGRVAIHDNVLVDAGDGHTALFLTDHNGTLDVAYVYNNTIYGGSRGIRFSVPARDDHAVIGNLIFSGEPIGGSLTVSRDNITDLVSNAPAYVADPSLVLGQMDFYPLPGGACEGASLDYPTVLLEHLHYNRDFNGTLKGSFTYRGAYAGDGANPGWILQDGLKQGGPGATADDSPPTVPGALSAIVLDERSAELAWSAASDAESGIAHYRIYRDGSLVAQTGLLQHVDTGLAESTTYAYAVSAVNGAGLESAPSVPVSATTPPDTTPPAIASVSADGDPTGVAVVFSEPVEEAGATDIANYSIDQGIVVSTASLGADLATVTLTTFAHSEGVPYTLGVANIRDRAASPNTIPAGTQATYTFAPALAVSNLSVASGETYAAAEGLDLGSVAYVDRSFTYTQLPAELVGATYILTANDDKLSQGDTLLSFDVNLPVTVWVVHDSRYAVKPAWMQDFTDSGQRLQVNVSFDLYAKEFPAGTIVLGGNVNPAEAEDNNMYTVILAPAQAAGPPPAPSGLRAY